MCCGYLTACVSSPRSYILTDNLCEQTRARFRCIRWYSKCSMGKLSSNLTENLMGKLMRRISIWLCYEIVQVYSASSGWRSSGDSITLSSYHVG
ncbi:hypothetical protein F383_08375 [Gossypium arboreum]|uniref:Uncharacterized protein n=1 Tax=Gossypium arboreum TaxID=29729 RepID=A0A0B0PH68_GOSAR|nr:hypothetical protein F383_08375 [Gossypium arboreum]